jgi:hypothetical protein
MVPKEGRKESGTNNCRLINASRCHEMPRIILQSEPFKKIMETIALLVFLGHFSSESRDIVGLQDVALAKRSNICRDFLEKKKETQQLQSRES